MRFTPSTNFSTYQAAGAKSIRWSVYGRSTTSLSGTVTGNTEWTDISQYFSDVPVLSELIEHDINQNVIEPLTLEASDISYWQNTLSSVTSQLYEIKIVGEIGINNSYATDVPTLYDGFIDIDSKINYKENDDTVSFTIRPTLAYLEKYQHLFLSSNYTFTNGYTDKEMVLPEIRGLNLLISPTYNLEVGLHTLSYSPSDTQVTLNNGLPYSVLSGTTASSFVIQDDRQNAISLRCINLKLLPSVQVDQKLIVLNKDATVLPYLWNTYQSASSLINSVLNNIGLTATYDNQLSPETTYDSSLIVCYVDNPPDSITSVAVKKVMVVSGAATSSTSSILIGIGNSVYARSSAGAYSRLFTVTSLTGGVTGFNPNCSIERMWFQNRTNSIWTITRLNTPALVNDLIGDQIVSRYNCTANNTASISVLDDPLIAYSINPNAAELIDINYTGALYKTGIFYCPISGSTKFFSWAHAANAITIATVINGVDDHLGTSQGVFVRNSIIHTSNFISSSSVKQFFRLWSVNGAGSYVSETMKNIGTGNVEIGQLAYSPSDDFIYFWHANDFIGASSAESDNRSGILCGLPYSTMSGIAGLTGALVETNIINREKTLPQYPAYHEDISYDPISGCVVAWGIDRTTGLAGLYTIGVSGTAIHNIVQDDYVIDKRYLNIPNYTSISGDPVTATITGINLSTANFKDYNSVVNRRGALGITTSENPDSFGGIHRNTVWYEGAWWGLNRDKALYQVANSANLIVPKISLDNDELSLFEYLNELLRSFSLISNITPEKSVKIYKRFNSSGKLLTTGNSITLDSSNIEVLSRNNEYPKVDIIEVRSNGYSTNYDGTNFDVNQTFNRRVVSLESDLIPVSLIKTYAYQLYQFFKDSKTKYSIFIPNKPYWQFEPLDGATLTLTDLKLSGSVTGVIYSTKLSKDGSVNLEVLA